MIKVEGLGKKYILHHETGRGYSSLRDTISRKAKNMVGLKGGRPPSREEFWALDDINFEIKQGETIGIIGRNGAGKSTLLKILSRITEPTKGRIVIDGRVASLLEIGTGFHHELTGRENIFLNGAILGMSRVEIRRKFDEIVEFSGVEKFLDTPVKHYSSGMNVRLAFAVAAHLEPEILVVDEVLAVGDAAFQKKCLGKMGQVSKQEGRTVLFVSHDLGSIAQLCEKAILLNEGRIVDFDSTSSVIKKYLHHQRNNFGYKASSSVKPKFLKEITLLNQQGMATNSFTHNESVAIRFSLVIDRWLPGLYLAFAIQNRFNKRVGLDYVEIRKEHITGNEPINLLISLPAQLLAPGSFSVDASITSPNIETFDEALGICQFEIIDNNSRITRFSKTDYGDVFLHATTNFNP